MNPTLHLIIDPLCGWCFGAAPLIEASKEIPDLNIRLHFGGLFAAPNNQTVDENMKNFIMSHHERITQLTGQTPGTAMVDLLNSGTALLDSTPPIQACLAAGIAAGSTIAYYQAAIKAHFIDGRRITEKETLTQIALECDIDAESFQQALVSVDTEEVAQHINDSRVLLQRLGGQGFPTFALEQDGQLQTLNHQRLYNNPTGWQRAIEEKLTPEVIH